MLSFPKFRSPDFAQEGWRVENQADQNVVDYLIGVVYNEMKGQ